MSTTIDKTNLDDFIKTNLVNATDNSFKLAKAVNVFLRDMRYQGYCVKQIFLEDGIRIIETEDHFQILKIIFTVQYSCVVLKNVFGDQIICHFNFSKDCTKLLVNYGIASLCSNRKVSQEKLLLQLVRKAENIFMRFHK
ncbi:hypothetical protein NNO96_13955 [Acinetobacter baumannii]|uniref:hypothetical protein n=1 Tax=Acinetobacter baumannii TaxID=470 RepID=UPI0020CC0A45|nr:hypothetical protein [Acinetobacter baumannii]MCQ1073308.1 hypothetical protein [Acinetobacter baumannii]